MLDSIVRDKQEIKELNRDELEELLLKVLDINMAEENYLLNITHDLRNPISVILSVIQCMNIKDISENKSKEYVEIIKRNGLKMVKLVDNLIDTTRLENKKYNIILRNVDIITMMESTISFTDKYAKQKNIQLVFDTNVEECIMAVDIEGFDRIIMNLLSNAIKFSKSNSTIYINVFDKDDKLHVSIKDEGPGIAEEEQKEIFSRFSQASKQKESEHCGSGIGLDLVSYLVKVHEGKIKLKSKLGEGSEFIIILPKRVIDEEAIINLPKDRKIQLLEVEFSDIYL